MDDNRKRIAYIDQIKGFAIFLVVLAHIMAWTYPDWKIARNHENVSTMLWWEIIYSFHMPLFFCVSGYLCSVKKGYNTFIRRRIQSLLLPFVTFTILGGVISGNLTWGDGPWFLKTLFLFSLIYALSSFVQKCLGSDNGLVLILIMLVFFMLFRRLIFSFNSEILNLVTDISHLSNFNFIGFLLGVALKKHKSIYEKINKDWGFSILILVWLLLFILHLHHINFPYIGYILIETSAIMAIWFFFDLFHNSNNYVEKVEKMNSSVSIKRRLELLGKYSLHIYLLHPYFRIRIIELGEYFLSLADKNEYTFSITLCTLQLVYSIVVTVLIITLCLLAVRFVEHSKIINFLFFGKT